MLAALFGAILGFPTLRLRGDYIAIVTLAFGEIIGRAAINGARTSAARNLTNGKIGINPIDKPDLPLLRPVHHAGLETLVLPRVAAWR